jgi:hypothetical protein
MLWRAGTEAHVWICTYAGETRKCRWRDGEVCAHSCFSDVCAHLRGLELTHSRGGGGVRHIFSTGACCARSRRLPHREACWFLSVCLLFVLFLFVGVFSVCLSGCSCSPHPLPPFPPPPVPVLPPQPRACLSPCPVHPPRPPLSSPLHLHPVPPRAPCTHHDRACRSLTQPLGHPHLPHLPGFPSGCILFGVCFCCRFGLFCFSVLFWSWEYPRAGCHIKCAESQTLEALLICTK